MPPQTDTRQQILTSAMTCFMRKGYHRATMDDIVVESGLSKGTLYWYFKSKKELFLALIQSVLEPIGQSWDSLIEEPNKTAVEKLRSITSQFRTELGEMASFFGIMMEAWSLTRHDEDVEFVVKGIYKPYLQIMTRIIDEGKSNGELAVDSAQSTAMVILVLYDGLTLFKGMDFLETDWDILMDATEKLLFQGLGVVDGHES